MTIESILGLVYGKREDFVLLKNSNFQDFLNSIPKDTIEQYVESKRLTCPQDLNTTLFIEWIDYSLKRLGKKHSELVELCKIEKTKFSKYMNGKGPLEAEHKDKIKGHLIKNLKDVGLVKS